MSLEGIDLFKVGDYEGAIEKYRQALAIDPSNGDFRRYITAAQEAEAKAAAQREAPAAQPTVSAPITRPKDSLAAKVPPLPPQQTWSSDFHQSPAVIVTPANLTTLQAVKQALVEEGKGKIIDFAKDVGFAAGVGVFHFSSENIEVAERDRQFLESWSTAASNCVGFVQIASTEFIQCMTSSGNTCIAPTLGKAQSIDRRCAGEIRKATMSWFKEK